jgi:hypothetical protein
MALMDTLFIIGVGVLGLAIVGGFAWYTFNSLLQGYNEARGNTRTRDE